MRLLLVKGPRSRIMAFFCSRSVMTWSRGLARSSAIITEENKRKELGGVEERIEGLEENIGCISQSNQ